MVAFFHDPLVGEHLGGYGRETIFLFLEDANYKFGVASQLEEFGTFLKILTSTTEGSETLGKFFLLGTGKG